MVAVTIVVAGVLAACGSDTSAVPGTGSPPSSSSSAVPSTTAAPRTIALGSMAVGVRTDTYVDTSRPTPANGSAAGAPTRSMTTTIWYPASGTAGGAPVVNAPVNRSRGPYPVVVFVHGFSVTPSTYSALLSRWASAGYVVVAPAVPLLNGDAPGGASHDDYPNANLADVRFVIGEVIRRAGVSTDLLGGLIDPLRVAVTGHSDGELLAYLLGLSGCCRDNRVRAVVAMAGNLGNADLLPEATGVPFLHFISENDEFNPVQATLAFDRANLHAPASWILLRGASHLGPFTDPGDSHFALVAQAGVDFLDGTLKDSAGLARLTTDVAAAGTIATLETAR